MEQSNKNIIIVLLKKMDFYLEKFYSEFKKKYNIDVFFISDKKLKNCYFYSNYLCSKNKLKNFTANFDKKYTAWERCFCFLKEENINYDYVWIIEDDVCVSKIDALFNIIKKYNKISYDLITNEISEYLDYKDWYHWNHILDHDFETAYKSFNCFCRLSKNLIIKFLNT